MKATEISEMQLRIAKFKRLEERLEELRILRNQLQSISGDNSKVGPIMYMRVNTSARENVPPLELVNLPVSNYKLRELLLPLVNEEYDKVLEEMEKL